MEEAMKRILLIPILLLAFSCAGAITGTRCGKCIVPPSHTDPSRRSSWLLDYRTGAIHTYRPNTIRVTLRAKE
jgi:hypothetical protein